MPISNPIIKVLVSIRECPDRDIEALCGCSDFRGWVLTQFCIDHRFYLQKCTSSNPQEIDIPTILAALMSALSVICSWEMHIFSTGSLTVACRMGREEKGLTASASIATSFCMLDCAVGGVSGTTIGCLSEMELTAERAIGKRGVRMPCGMPKSFGSTTGCFSFCCFACFDAAITEVSCSVEFPSP
ncbi:hypothetical protein WR25_01364 [Diploscapter pachys]|uniref:Uncharacterized protein n=1 Tax=Diploscapter pachys TaxID=2018661 RepID=A0A2A2KV68_9BILA|nr:hypothetical protein WR25_01364 [Diploscapter pachys]